MSKHICGNCKHFNTNKTLTTYVGSCANPSSDQHKALIVMAHSCEDFKPALPLSRKKL